SRLATLRDHRERSRIGFAGQADARTDLAFFVQEIGESYAVEHVVDALLEEKPDGADAAGVCGAAALFLDGVRDAMQVERRRLGRLDHVADGDILGTAGQRVAAPRA